MNDISEMSAVNVGKRIKEARKEKGYTIKNISEYTGLSVGYLSMLEQNKTSPTIENLLKIGDILEVQLTEILRIEKEKKIVIRAEETKVHEYPKYNQEIRLYDFGYGKQTYEYLTIHAGAMEEEPEFRHPYNEVGTILSGELIVTIGKNSYHLKKGDSIFIPKHMIHVMRNEGTTTCESFWIVGIA